MMSKRSSRKITPITPRLRFGCFAVGERTLFEMDMNTLLPIRAVQGNPGEHGRTKMRKIDKFHKENTAVASMQQVTSESA